jgi:hypothetical protein
MWDPNNLLGFPRQTPGSQINLNTSNGTGSVNTSIRLFLNISDQSQGDMVAVQSPTEGTSIIIKQPGLFFVSYTDSLASASGYGVTTNSTADIGAVPQASIICATQNPAGVAVNCAGMAWLRPGNIVRANITSGVGIDTAGRVRLWIVRIL